MTNRRQLILIPGVGDDHWVYHAGARIFGIFGFEVHIHVFGWDSADPASYERRMRDIDDFVRSLSVDGPVYLLGVSAGGPVAVSELAKYSPGIVKVATLCSPLSAFSYRVNPLLEVAIQDVESVLSSMSDADKLKILSVRALVDNVVPVRLSQPAGIRTAIVPSFIHAVSIFLGQTIGSYPILRFFKQR